MLVSIIHDGIRWDQMDFGSMWQLVSIPRVAIWNVTTKQVILIFSDFQISGDRNL